MVAGVALAVLLAGLALTLPRPSVASASPADSNLSAADRYIVILEDDADAISAARVLGRLHGLAVGHVYSNALQGFAAVVPEGRLAALMADPRVVSVQADAVVSI